MRPTLSGWCPHSEVMSSAVAKRIALTNGAGMASPGLTAWSNAATDATMGAEKEVPVPPAYPGAVVVVVYTSPGAAMDTATPQSEPSRLNPVTQSTSRG